MTVLTKNKVNPVGKKVVRAMDITLENLDDYLADGNITPVHPGKLFKTLVIEGTGVTVQSVAQKSGISREMLHRILRGDASITAKTAIGLAEASGTEPSFWLRAQNIYDLWNERQKRNGAPPAPRPPRP